MWTVALQRRRLRSAEPEDEQFIFRWWADLQFLIIALRRLRRAAQIASGVATYADAVQTAIAAFDKSLPDLEKMRNVGEHVDAYAIDHPNRHHKEIDRRMLQVAWWDGSTYKWLDASLNVDEAFAAAEDLVSSLQRLGVQHSP